MESKVNHYLEPSDQVFNQINYLFK